MQRRKQPLGGLVSDGCLPCSAGLVSLPMSQTRQPLLVAPALRGAAYQSPCMQHLHDCVEVAADLIFEVRLPLPCSVQTPCCAACLLPAGASRVGPHTSPAAHRTNPVGSLPLQSTQLYYNTLASCRAILTAFGSGAGGCAAGAAAVAGGDRTVLHPRHVEPCTTAAHLRCAPVPCLPWAPAWPPPNQHPAPGGPSPPAYLTPCPPHMPPTHAPPPPPPVDLKRRVRL